MSNNRSRFLSENRDTILAYVESGGDESMIQLNDVQKVMLERWRFADELIRKGGEYFLRENVALRIMDKFSVSRDTAYKDIVSAEHVFYSSAPLNKKYWIQRRVEYIQRIIDNLCTLVEDKGEEGKVYWMGDADKFEVAARWEAVLQKYIDKFPEFMAPRSPKKIVYNIMNNILVNNSTTIQDADVKFETVLKRLEESEDY